MRTGTKTTGKADRLPLNFYPVDRWTCGAALTIQPASDASGPAAPDAQVAQLVEHATENRSVGGSIPPLGTIPFPLHINDFKFDSFRGQPLVLPDLLPRPFRCRS